MNIVVVITIIIGFFLLFDLIIIIVVFRNRRQKNTELKLIVRRAWHAINNISEPKLQILEIDKWIEQIMKIRGYSGSFGQKARRMSKDYKTDPDEMWQIHKLRNRIAHETDFAPDSRMAKRCLVMAENILQRLK